MLKVMLDTNIVIYVLKRRPIEVLTIFNQHVGQMCISAITLAELLHGVEKSARPVHNLAQRRIGNSTASTEVSHLKSIITSAIFSLFRHSPNVCHAHPIQL